MLGRVAIAGLERGNALGYQHRGVLAHTCIKAGVHSGLVAALDGVTVLAQFLEPSSKRQGFGPCASGHKTPESVNLFGWGTSSHGASVSQGVYGIWRQNMSGFLEPADDPGELIEAPWVMDAADG